MPPRSLPPDGPSQRPVFFFLVLGGFPPQTSLYTQATRSPKPPPASPSIRPSAIVIARSAFKEFLDQRNSRLFCPTANPNATSKQPFILAPASARDEQNTSRPLRPSTLETFCNPTPPR
ncbi:hypothetical protein LY76DRAFT_350515 [Colletotrichum caudatum]|nr:hypothetical protein LY76DRAFT_350515 [Colletotrichum caudatum]